ncbi:MAG: hypothetical protein ACO1RT_08335 [Planctomycetaceae bacterium]
MSRRVVGWAAISLFNATLLLAQPPRPREDGPRREDGPPREHAGPHEPGRDRPEPGRGRPEPRGHHPFMPLIDALDKDRDHILSPEELRTATESLSALDRDRDGRLTPDEFGPREGRPREGGPREGGPREGGPREGGPREGGPRGPRGEAFDGPPPHRGPGARPGFGQPGPGGPDRPPMPNPERFVDHAMQFDADGDKKLDREELIKFAQSMPHHGPGDMAPGRPDRPRDEGERDRDRREESPRDRKQADRPDQE